MALTDVSVRSLPAPPAGFKIHLDDVVQGFGVRVSSGGTKTYVLTYGKDRRRVALGRVGIVTLAEARAEARRILAQRTLAGHKARSISFQEARTAFLAASERKNRTSTHKGYKSRLSRVEWGTKSLGDVTPRAVLAKLSELDSLPMEKRYTFVVLRTFFNWCVQNHHLDVSPIDRLAVPPISRSRERTLSSEELKAIWRACPDNAFGRTVKILAATGLRRGEVEHLVVDGDLANLSGDHTKNGRQFTVPMPAIALQLASQPRKWVGWGKSKKRLDEASKVANWTLHDLRRTYATIHAQLGTPPHIIEALLNHKSGIISGVAATYNRFQYIEPMREAVQNYEKHLTTLLE